MADDVAGRRKRGAPKRREPGKMHPDLMRVVAATSGDLTADESQGFRAGVAAMRKHGRTIPLAMFAGGFKRPPSQERLKTLHDLAVDQAGVRHPIMSRR